jgi:hypothetical protein
MTVSDLALGTHAGVFWSNIEVVKGATATLVDKSGQERTLGSLNYDDKLNVVSQDQSTTAIYYLNFLTEENPDNNLAPTVSVAFADTSIKINAPTINVSAAADDDGMPWPHKLTMSWEVAQGEAGNVSIASPDAQSTDVTFSAVGTYVLRFTADDGELHDMGEVNVSVSSPDNDAPVVSVAFPDSTIESGSTISVSATASDDGYPDPPAALTYSWTVISGNAANVTIASPDQLTTDVTISTVGDYVLQISVSDGEVSTTRTVSITSQIPEGIEALESGVRMYPNPASDVLTIELQNVAGPSDIRIFDLTGKPVYMERHVNSFVEIDVSGFEEGIYFVTVSYGKESAIYRLNILK